MFSPKSQQVLQQTLSRGFQRLNLPAIPGPPTSTLATAKPRFERLTTYVPLDVVPRRQRDRSVPRQHVTPRILTQVQVTPPPFPEQDAARFPTTSHVRDKMFLPPSTHSLINKCCVWQEDDCDYPSLLRGTIELFSRASSPRECISR